MPLSKHDDSIMIEPADSDANLYVDHFRRDPEQYVISTRSAQFHILEGRRPLLTKLQCLNPCLERPAHLNFPPTTSKKMSSQDPKPSEVKAKDIKLEYKLWDRSHKNMKESPPSEGRDYLKHAKNLLNLLEGVGELHPIAVNSEPREGSWTSISRFRLRTTFL